MVDLRRHNLLDHLADLNLHFTLFLLAHVDRVRVRNFFRHLARNLNRACAGFFLADRHVVGVGLVSRLSFVGRVLNLLLNLIGNPNTCCASTSTAVGSNRAASTGNAAA